MFVFQNMSHRTCLAFPCFPKEAISKWMKEAPLAIGVDPFCQHGRMWRHEVWNNEMKRYKVFANRDSFKTLLFARFPGLQHPRKDENKERRFLLPHSIEAPLLLDCSCRVQEGEAVHAFDFEGLFSEESQWRAEKQKMRPWRKNRKKLPGRPLAVSCQTMPSSKTSQLESCMFKFQLWIVKTAAVDTIQSRLSRKRLLRTRLLGKFRHREMRQGHATSDWDSFEMLKGFDFLAEVLSFLFCLEKLFVEVLVSWCSWGKIPVGNSSQDCECGGRWWAWKLTLAFFKSLHLYRSGMFWVC